MPETRYAPCGDLSLAYQVFGDGPVELVYAGSFVSHVELFWTMPEFEAFMERLSRFCRIVMFDKAGLIVNRMPDMSLKDSLDTGSLDLLAVIPDDREMALSDMSGQSVFELPPEAAVHQGAVEALTKLGIL